MTTKRVYKVRSLDEVDFDRTPEIEGTIQEFDTIEIDGKQRPFMVIDTGQQTVRVFDSKALEDAFNQGAEGDHIRLEYRGKVKIKGTPKTFKRFNVQVWTEEECADEETKDAPF